MTGKKGLQKAVAALVCAAVLVPIGACGIFKEEFDEIIRYRVDLLIGYFGSRHRLDEFFNRLPEKINPFSVQKHIIRPSD